MGTASARLPERVPLQNRVDDAEDLASLGERPLLNLRVLGLGGRRLFALEPEQLVDWGG